MRGDQETQKKFHSYVLFLGELYLNLEVSSQPMLSFLTTKYDKYGYYTAL